MAGAAPGAAQGGGQAAPGGVREGGAGRLVEGVRDEVAGDADALQLGDLVGGQGARPHVEPAERAREDRVGGVVGAAEPVVGEGAEGRRGQGHRRVPGDGRAVDVERSGAAADGDREVAPAVQGQCGGAVEGLLGAGPVGGHGEPGHAGGVAHGQVEVAGRVVAEVQDAGPGAVVGGSHPGGQGDLGGAAEDCGRKVDVPVRPAHVLRGPSEPSVHAQDGRVVPQRLAHLRQRADHRADPVRVHLLTGARVRLGQHGEEVPGAVAAQIAVGLAVEPFPAAGGGRAQGGQAGVGAEHLEQPVHVVAAGVVEHQLPLGGEDTGTEPDGVEGGRAGASGRPGAAVPWPRPPPRPPRPRCGGRRRWRGSRSAEGSVW